MNKKQQYIIIGLVLIVIIASAAVIWFQRNREDSPLSGSNQGGSLHAPEFMTEGEKQQFQLAPESRVQVISRDQEGQVNVYKVIRNEGDVVADPSQLPAISPRPQSETVPAPAAE